LDKCSLYLAPIAAVMQFCSADFEARQLHLSGKRDGFIFKPKSSASKKSMQKCQLLFCLDILMPD